MGLDTCFTLDKPVIDNWSLSKKQPVRQSLGKHQILMWHVLSVCSQYWHGLFCYLSMIETN